MHSKREISQKKRRKRTVLLADLSAVPESAGLWGARERDEARAREALCERVRAAVREALTDKQREAVELYFFEGLSQGEIAARLGLTQQVVHKRLFGDVREGRAVGGAMRKLRERLAPVVAPGCAP